MVSRGLAVPLTLTYSGFAKGIAYSRSLLRGFERSTNSALRRISTQFRAMAGFLNPLRAGFAAIATAIPLAAVEKLNQAMQKSVAVLGGVTDEMRGKMRQAAIDISKTTKFYAHQAAEGYFFLASAGMDAQESLSALPAVAEFAQAGIFDLARATDLLLDAQTAMGLRSKDAGKNLENLRRVSDSLTMGNKLSTATIEQMAEGLANGLGGALRLVNKDVEEGAALLAVFAERGTKGLAGGTAASIIMRDLQTKSIKHAEEFRKANVKVWDDKGQMRSFVDILKDLEAGVAKSPRGGKIFLMDLKIMDKSSRHLLDLMGQSDNLAEKLRRIREEGGGSTKRMADDVLTPLQKSWNEFKGAFTQFSEHLQPVLTMLASLMSGAAHALESKEAGIFGSNLADMIVKTVGAIGDGIQLMIHGVLEFLAMARNMIHKFRQTPGAKQFGMGYSENEWKTQKDMRWEPSKGKFVWDTTRTLTKLADGDTKEAGQASVDRFQGRSDAWGSKQRFRNWLGDTMKAGGSMKPELSGNMSGLGAMGMLGNTVGPMFNKGPKGTGSRLAGGLIGLSRMFGMDSGTTEEFNKAAWAHQAKQGRRGMTIPEDIAAAAMQQTGVGRGLGAIGGAARGVGGYLGGNWANATQTVRQHRQKMAAEAMPGWASAGRAGMGALGAVPGLMGGLAETFTADKNPMRMTKAPWMKDTGFFGGAQQKLRDTGNFEFMQGNAPGVGQHLLQSMQRLQMLKQSGMSNNAMRAEDPTSREGHAQRVRAKRGQDVDKVNRQILAETKKQTAAIQKIVDRGVVLMAANLGGGE